MPASQLKRAERSLEEIEKSQDLPPLTTEALHEIVDAKRVLYV
jgi:hypothetical protein